MTLTELLVDFGVDEDRAKDASKRWDENSFEDMFIQLECLMGFDNTVEVLTEGDILDYENGYLGDYMRMARIVSGQMKHRVSRDHASIFYSLNNLNGYVDLSSKEEESGIDISVLNLGPLRLLHPDNSRSVKYLNELIEDGEISFGEHEHWMRGNGQESGPRAATIGVAIKSQLKQIFNELGLEEPCVSVNYGKRCVWVDEYTSTKLREIRAKAYIL